LAVFYYPKTRFFSTTKAGYKKKLELLLHSNVQSHLKSKHGIHVIHQLEDHKTIPAQEEIRSQIVIKEMSLFEATKKRSNNLGSCTMP